MNSPIIAAIAVVAVLFSMLPFPKEKQVRPQNVFHTLHSGINIGNSLDANHVLSNQPDASVEDFETAWGNPVISRTLIDAIADSGLKTVRLPVSWGEHIREDGTVDPAWMERVMRVTEYILSKGLYVILDSHHEDWLIPSPEREGETREKLVSLWTQIAEAFQNVNEHLIFEGMNEPRMMGTDMEWTAGTSETREVVNNLNQAFVDTVRGTGGKNSTRKLMIATYCNSQLTDAVKDLRIPDDKNIIVSIHAYIPYDFAGNKNEVTSWSSANRADTAQIKHMIYVLEKAFLDHNIPVVITEFGCREGVDPKDRLEWTKYYTRTAFAAGIPCIWWDDGSGYHIIDRNTGEWLRPDILEALLQDQ